jgi:hypothetical protein
MKDKTVPVFGESAQKCIVEFVERRRNIVLFLDASRPIFMTVSRMRPVVYVDAFKVEDLSFHKGVPVLR